MAIKGMTDAIVPQFPRIGVLRKGAAKDARGVGRDLDHFRFTSDDTAALARFADTYGDQPRSINVMLTGARPDDCWDTWKEAWTASQLQHRCDGETCTIWYDAKTKRYSQTPRPCPGGCRQVGRLSVFIPELERLAYVTLQTTSTWDILGLTENLLAAYALRGNLTGIPFILSRREREISVPMQDGKRSRRKVWLVYLEPSPAWVALQISAMQRQALPAGAPQAPLMLPSPTAIPAVTSDELADDEQLDEGTGEIISPTSAAAPVINLPPARVSDQDRDTAPLPNTLPPVTPAARRPLPPPPGPDERSNGRTWNHLTEQEKLDVCGKGFVKAWQQAIQEGVVSHFDLQPLNMGVTRNVTDYVAAVQALKSLVQGWIDKKHTRELQPFADKLREINAKHAPAEYRRLGVEDTGDPTTEQDDDDEFGEPTPTAAEIADADRAERNALAAAHAA